VIHFKKVAHLGLTNMAALVLTVPGIVCDAIFLAVFRFLYSHFARRIRKPSTGLLFRSASSLATNTSMRQQPLSNHNANTKNNLYSRINMKLTLL